MPKELASEDEAKIPTVATRLDSTSSVQGLRISVVDGPDNGLSVNSELDTVVIGRSSVADVRLSDATASSFHVELSSHRHGVLVRDLESLNGTLHCGARIARAVVPSGATLEIGSSLVRVELDSPRVAESHVLESFGALRGKSLVMKELFSLLTRLADTELAVLLEGPTGTGKELAARGIHDASAHAGAPFVVLDCAAIPATLAESTLFGHERGAFTGATERRPGVFEAAADGTIFLDEVGELPSELQPKLLRVLEQRQVVRLGSVQPIPVQARVLSATLRDLRARINQGVFREDLYYRLAQARVSLPSLSERREDVPVLVEHFLANLPPTARGARQINAEALQALSQRDYAGNVRELRHTVERVAMLAESDTVLPSDLTFERILVGECRREESGGTAGLGLATDPSLGPMPMFKEAKRTAVEEFERDYLSRLLKRADNNLSRASALAGVERHHLRNLLRKRGLWSKK